MVYAVVSKTTSRKAVWVRLPPWAPVKIIKTGFLILSVVYMLYHALNPSSFDLLDYVNLIIHEAGHLIFAFFGEFVSFTGGTFFQLLIPLLFVIYFLRKDLYSASIVSFWLAHSLINVSVYIKDAIVMQLPLLGGGIHDWNYMLSKLNMLSLAPVLGSIVYFLGVTIIIGGTISGIYSLIYDRKVLTI
jgi:hypothetical protein